MNELGVVVIGRNEGLRLERCLASVLACTRDVLYVDSASSDGSAEQARRMGVAVLELDPARPMSAARARNEGFAQLLRRLPGLRFVQFVDGDCELAAGWLAHGRAELERSPAVAVVCGRIRERDPEASPYNRMCALEWDRAPGDVRSCGGNLMVKVDAFRDVGGFRADVVAAEDDELCLRLRAAGGRIRLLDADMVHHDAALLRFSQWWRRATRCGHAYALGHALHGRGPEHHFRRELLSLVLWGGALPVLALGVAAAKPGLALLPLAGYAALGGRIFRHGRRRGWSRQDAHLYAILTVLSKFPGLWGALRFYLDRWRGRHPALIEHKQKGSDP
jgi:GT2 family glycosyltransferase